MAEDDLVMAKLLEFNLQRAGFEVMVCGDGGDVLERTRVLSPDLAVFDLNLPGKTGLELSLAFQADAALVTSGTATLEAALIGTPQIIIYKTSPATYWFGRMVLTIQHIGLVNIVAKRTVCPELIQQDATPESMAEEIARLLNDTAKRSAMLAGYKEVRQLLGARSAAENAAEILLKEVGGG